MSALNPGLRLSDSEAEIVQAEPDWHDARRAPGQPTEKKNTWWLPAHGLAIRLKDRKQKMKVPGADACQRQSGRRVPRCPEGREIGGTLEQAVHHAATATMPTLGLFVPLDRAVAQQSCRRQPGRQHGAAG